MSVKRRTWAWRGKTRKRQVLFILQISDSISDNIIAPSISDDRAVRRWGWWAHTGEMLFLICTIEMSQKTKQKKNKMPKIVETRRCGKGGKIA